jgi:hypothetical protein
VSSQHKPSSSPQLARYKDVSGAHDNKQIKPNTRNKTFKIQPKLCIAESLFLREEFLSIWLALSLDSLLVPSKRC